MLKPFLLNVGAIVASTSVLMQSTIAAPLLPPPPFPPVSAVLDANAPLCYIQFQGSSAIDVSNVCGKMTGTAPRSIPISVSNAMSPPIFNPNVMNASTTGQCNFIDANGKPCPQK